MPQRPQIDLNADLGESFGNWRMGDDHTMLSQVTSANIACGFHAGDPLTLRSALEAAQAQQVAVGAHVAYPDLVGFGRRFLDASEPELSADVLYQLSALEGMAQVAGTQVAYVKPHGALYHASISYAPHAVALSAAVADFSAAVGRAVPLLLPPATAAGAPLGHQYATKAGVPVAREIFADRAYRADGSLVPRGEPGAVVTQVPQVVEAVQRFVEESVVLTIDGDRLPVKAESICLHGDTPDSVAMATAVRAALEGADVQIRSFT